MHNVENCNNYFLRFFKVLLSTCCNCTSTLESKDQTANRGLRGSGRGGAVKRQENVIHGRAGSSRETAADLQSKGHWTGTKALFRQSECSVSCDGWWRSV